MLFGGRNLEDARTLSSIAVAEPSTRSRATYRSTYVGEASDRRATYRKTVISEQLRRSRAIGHDGHLALAAGRESRHMKSEEHADAMNMDLQYEAESEHTPQKGAVPTTLAWKGVGFSVGKKGAEHTILEPSDGMVEAGSLVALMGPSGSGKSTLLEILAGVKTAPYQGRVYIDGHDKGRDYSLLTSFVPQHDSMFAHMSVRETLLFNAALRVPLAKGETVARHHEIVSNTLEEVGLAHVANTLVGSAEVRGVSGGQRQRLALSKGLMCPVVLMFADEPTSGLSSTDAEVIVRLLRRATRRKRISVLVVIHQPKQSIAAQFDDLILLASDPGRVCYHGAFRDAFSYYEQAGLSTPAFVNPADFYLDCVSPSSAHCQADMLVEHWTTSGRAEAMAARVVAQLASPGRTQADLCRLLHGGELSPTARYAAPFRVQLATLWKRAILLQTRDKNALLSEIFGLVGLGTSTTTADRTRDLHSATAARARPELKGPTFDARSSQSSAACLRISPTRPPFARSSSPTTSVSSCRTSHR